MLLSMHSITFEDQDTTPTNEPCLQVGKATWGEMVAEARRMIEVLEARFPDLDLLEYRIVRNPHDFGDYPSIRVRFEDTEEGWAQYNHLESNWPRTWNDTAPVPYVPQTLDSD